MPFFMSFKEKGKYFLFIIELKTSWKFQACCSNLFQMQELQLATVEWKVEN